MEEIGNEDEMWRKIAAVYIKINAMPKINERYGT